MRIGRSPTRNQISDYRPARVTVAMLVFIPELTGYFRHRLDVLKLCLGSIVRNTDAPYDLLVFDNGSCAEVVDYLRSLQDKGIIQHLILSTQNIGKIGAFQFLFRAAPGDIIAYCDDDIFFYPGWLSAHLRIIEAFPKVGMVSGWAIRHTFSYGNKSCLKLTETDPSISLEEARCIPDEWEIDFALSTGRDPQQYLAGTVDVQDIILHCNGISAYATSDHFQFVSPKSVIVNALPEDWSGRLMGQMVELDEAIDAAGYLRLSTIDRYVRHMGNVLSSDFQAEASALGLEVEVPKISRSPLILRKLARKLRMRQLLNLVYDRLYWILNFE